MTHFNEPSATRIAEIGYAELSLGDEPEMFDFPSRGACYGWLNEQKRRITSSRVYAFDDGSVFAEVHFNTTTLFQKEDLQREDPEKRINEIYQVLANPTTHPLSQAQRTLLVGEFQKLVQSRSTVVESDSDEPHQHRCSTCERSFSHDAEEECPEISGKYYCGLCFPTAAEHSHYCPICAESWAHYSKPDCTLGEAAGCVKHETVSHPNGRGLAAVAGMVELKALLYEQVIAPLRDPQRFAKWRITAPNGILMFGPPGCGKTYIAQKLAEELGYFFREISASSVGDTFVHGTSGKIASVFSEAEQNAPAVLFLDEFESLVPDRSHLSGHHDYRVEEISEFLRQLDSAGRRRILVIAATNEPWRIDPAVQRAGRLDKRILVAAPDMAARIELLRFHLEERFRETNLDLPGIAQGLEGYSATDAKLLVEEAARSAARKDAPISMGDLLTARKLVPPSLPEHITRKYDEYGERGAPA